MRVSCVIIDHLPLSQTNDYRGQSQKVETESGVQVNGPPGLKEKKHQSFSSVPLEEVMLQLHSEQLLDCRALGVLLVLAAKSCNMLES